MDARLQRRFSGTAGTRRRRATRRFWQAQLAPAQDRLLAARRAPPGRARARRGLRDGAGHARRPPSGSGRRITCWRPTSPTGMVDEACATEAARRGLAHVSAARMDAEGLDVPRRSFDVVLCALGLMYVPDPVAALRRMRARARSQADAPSSPCGARAAAAAGRRSSPSSTPACSRKSARCSSSWVPATSCRGRDAGCRVRRRDRRRNGSTSVLHYDSPEDACGAAFAAGRWRWRTRASTTGHAPRRTRSTWRRSRQWRSAVTRSTCRASSWW
jgi:hypothetical protein